MQLELTDIARRQITMAMEDEEGKTLALRIAINGRSSNGFQYQMDLVDTDEKKDDDTVIQLDGFDVYVDPDSAPKLDGATVDFVQKLQEAGFKFDNPNSPWSDPVAADVAQVIDSKVNPQIASHGGFVTLVDVKDKIAYITMGGGCQGCGMADVTLKQGIEGNQPQKGAQYPPLRRASGEPPDDGDLPSYNSCGSPL